MIHPAVPATAFTSRADLLTHCLLALEQAGFPLTVLHGYETFPDEIPSDVDVVSAWCSGRRLGREIAGVLESTNATLVNVIRHEYSCYFYVICLRSPGEEPSFLQLDVAFDFRRDGRIFLSGDELLVDAARFKGFLVADRATTFVYYAIKRIGKRCVEPAHAAYLASLYASDPASCREKALRHWSPGSVDEICAAAATGDWDEVRRDIDRLRKDLLSTTSRRAPLQVARFRVEDAIRVVGRVARPTGVFVAFYGPDGSGKSSAIDALTRTMAPAFRRVETMHWRPYVLGKRPEEDVGAADPHNAPPYSPAKSVLKAAYLACDFVLGYIVRLRPALVRSTLLVADRYAGDLYVDAKRYRYDGPRWLARAIQRLAPGPDLSVVLTTDPETLYGRKPDSDVAVLADLSERYARFSKERGHVLVDAGQEIGDVVAAVEDRLIEALRSRALARVGVQ